MPLILGFRAQRQRDHYEFGASLFYIASSRAAKAISHFVSPVLFYFSLLVCFAQVHQKN